MADACLDDNDIAELLSATPAGARFERIEGHLDECATCRGLVADMLGVSGLQAADDDDTVVDGPGAPEPTPLVEPGMEIDHYRVVTLLGRGGMGDVYLARDTKLGRKVALKMVRSALLVDEDAVGRFQREARMTARFDHPNIVTIHAVGEHRGRPYVALQYLEGETLRQRMKRGPLEDWPAVARSIAAALAEAHRHDVLHRDLKPDNVHLGRDGQVRVLDFGLAKLARDPAPRTPVDPEAVDLDLFQTKHSAIAGTPLYMAPEQWRGDEMTGAVDVWALGVIMFRLATEQRPFGGGGLDRLAADVLSDEPAPRVDAIAPGTSAALADLIADCLAKTPSRRPRIDAVVAALTEPKEPRVSDAVVVREPPRRLGWWVAALVAAGGIVAGLSLRGSADEAETPAASATVSVAVVEEATPAVDTASASSATVEPEVDVPPSAAPPATPPPSRPPAPAASTAPPPPRKETLFGTRE